jgi:hypothetical protein
MARRSGPLRENDLLHVALRGHSVGVSQNFRIDEHGGAVPVGTPEVTSLR